MKVLIDECMPWKIGRHLVDHDCESVVTAGLSGQTNGDLLRLAEAAGYELLLTVDQGIPYQQNLEGLHIALIIIHARSNKIEVLLPHVAAVLEALRSIQPGQVVRVG
ncbi:MAG: hypothetical protein ACJ74Y_16800 [Bryobacteraceae bacterium]